MVIACPADSGLYGVILIPEGRLLPQFRADLERAFMDHALACAPVADKLTGARRVGKLQGIVRWESFFRESAGPGWALVGDAGQFKDPTLGQGMTDAFGHLVMTDTRRKRLRRRSWRRRSTRTAPEAGQVRVGGCCLVVVWLGLMSPVSYARTTAWTRSRTPSFVRMRVT